MAFRSYFRGFITYSERYRRIRVKELDEDHLLTLNGTAITVSGEKIYLSLN